VLAFLVAGVLLLWATVGWAEERKGEWYLAGDLLQARYQGPQVDGTWRQDHVPGNHMTLESMAWDVGLGYRFADGEAWYTKQLSVEGGYRHYGSGVSSGGPIVGDADYHQIRFEGVPHQRFKKNVYEATDHSEGGYVRVTKGLLSWHGLEPYVSVGVEVLYHDLNIWVRNPCKPGRRAWTGGFTGFMAGPTVGGGIKYEVWNGIKARFGAESHWSLTESGHPISSQWLLVGGGVEVPLTAWW
jgi:opacity protein-like surface antigen